VGEIGFRRLREDDLPLLHAWFQREHVRRWWKERSEYDEVVAHYRPSIVGDDPTELYLILLDDAPVGFVQTYLVDDYDDYAALLGVGDGVAGVDLLIGEPDLVGKGVGSAAIDAFVERIVFARQDTLACIADPDARNTASLRAFEKAGFRAVREFVDPEDGERHVLVRRDRT